MYIRKRYFFQDSIEVEEHHKGRYGAPGEKRGKRKKPTPEQIAKVNQKNKENNVRRLIKWNFHKNDYWITLTYRKDRRPDDISTAKKQFGNCLRKLRRIWRKAGEKLKWIAAIECGSRGGIHIHMIINRIPDGDIALRKAWQWGGVHIDLLYSSGGFCDLAEYISKRPEKALDKWYSHSKNLIKKQPEVQRMSRSTLGKEPKPPKGYYLDKNTFYEGINPVTGFPYRSYTFVKIEKRRE